MSCSLDAPRGADFTRRYVFPDSYVLTGYPATFNIYETTGGTLLLSVIAISNINDSETLSLDNVITVNVTKEDLALLPENDDPTLPSLLRYELLLTSPDLTVTDKLAGGSFRILPFGFAQRNDGGGSGGGEITVSFGGDDVTVSIDGGSTSNLLLAGKANLSLNNLVTPWADNAQTERVVGRRTLPVRTLLRDWVWLDEEGADMTGELTSPVVTANTTALLAAHNRLPYGGKIRVRGTCGINGGWITRMNAGVEIIGEEGPYRSVLVGCSAAGTLISLGDAGRVENLKIVAKSGLIRTGIAIGATDVNGASVVGCTLSDSYGLIYAAATTLNSHGGFRVDECILRNPTANADASGSFGIYLGNLFDTRVRSLVMAPRVEGDPPPGYGLRIQGGNTYVISDANITASGDALIIDPTNELLNVIVDKCWFDKHLEGDGATIRPGVGGKVVGTSFSQTWFGNSLNSGLVLDGSLGLIDHVDLSACQFANNGKNPNGTPSTLGGYGLKMTGAAVTSSVGVKRVTMTGGIASGNSLSGAFLGNNVVGFAAQSIKAGDFYAYGGNGAYGIQGDTSPVDYSVSFCDLRGNTGSASNLTDASSTKLYKFNMT